MLNEILIGCDNAAVRYKEMIIKHLESLGVKVENVGCDTADDPTFYPVVAKRLCDRIAESGYTKKGILICGTGIGMAISANKVPGIRAAQTHDTFSAERAAKSNDAHIITLGARVVGTELAKTIANAWLASEFDPAGPSAANVAAIGALDSKYRK